MRHTGNCLREYFDVPFFPSIRFALRNSETRKLSWRMHLGLSYGARKLGCFCASRLLDEQWFLLVVFLFNCWGIHWSFSQCDNGDISGSLFSSDFVGFRLSSNNQFILQKLVHLCAACQELRRFWEVEDSRLLYCLAREIEFVSKYNYEVHTKQIWHITFFFKPKELLLLTHNGIY